MARRMSDTITRRELVKAAAIGTLAVGGGALAAACQAAPGPVSGPSTAGTPKSGGILKYGLVRDIKQTFRLLSSNRGVAIALLLTIAVGVGGTAAVFSAVYGVLLRPLPYSEPDRLVRM